jgi:hypothetical protein
MANKNEFEFIEEFPEEEKKPKVKKEPKPKKEKAPKEAKQTGLSKSTKILLASISAVVLISVVVLLWYLFFSPPKLEDVYDRVVELVEESQEVNTVFYGAGLPVHDSNGDYADFTHMYFDFKYKGSYEIVTDQAKFISVMAIQNKAEQVYSKSYLENVLYPFAFTGYAVDNVGGNIAVARYLEDEEWIYRATSGKNYLEGTRIYDYSTMKIAYPGNSKAFYVTMDSWLEENPDEIETVRLRIVQQDGQWYLDSFTG